MKRLIAFALALAVVFGVSFALYKPERIEAAAQETMDDEWVGYFFALEPFDGRRYATENGDDYDFGVPGVPVFVTITAFEPDDPDYEEGSEFNNSVGAAVSDEVVGSGMHIKVDDNGSSYETGGEIALDALGQAELYECYVYRTSAGDYYAECTQANGTNVCYRTPSANLNQTRTISTERSSDWRANGKAQGRSIKVSVSFAAHTAAESVEFVWMDSDKNVLSRGIRRRRSSRDAGRTRACGASRHGDAECGRYDRAHALHAGRSVRQSLCSLDAFRTSARCRCLARLGRGRDLTNS